MSEPLYFNTPVINAEGNIITLTDLAGGGGGGIEAKLLWENSDPTSSFASQTITDIDLENFTHLLTLFRNSNSVEVYQLAITSIKGASGDFTDFREGTGIIKISASAPTMGESAKKACYLRVVEGYRTTKSIYFGSGLSTSSSSAVNTSIIPYKVYGIDLSSILS